MGKCASSGSKTTESHRSTILLNKRKTYLVDILDRIVVKKLYEEFVYHSGVKWDKQVISSFFRLPVYSI